MSEDLRHELQLTGRACSEEKHPGSRSFDAFV